MSGTVSNPTKIFLSTALAQLAQLARNLAVEWGPQGVRANATAPGLIRTPLAAGLIADDAFMARRLAMTPLRRVGEPLEVAGVAVMLVAAAGAFISGQALVVDSGTLVSDGGCPTSNTARHDKTTRRRPNDFKQHLAP